jgi:protein TonB
MRSLSSRPAAWALLLVACVDSGDVDKMASTFRSTGTHIDEAPLPQNKELPFRYPASLYAQRVQGNVTLRIFIDAHGRVVQDSTQVVESSGYQAFDSAAVAGAPELRFVPAKLRGEAVATSILLPVFFRHPQGSPLPGDSVLHPRPAGRQ